MDKLIPVLKFQLHFPLKVHIIKEFKKMKIREIITTSVNKETGEIEVHSNFKNGLLYGLYAVTDNKTVRAKEKKLTRWWNNNKEIPGYEMSRTNRGWFLDGYHLDEKSTEKWFNLTGNQRYAKPKVHKKWNSAKKQEKKH